MELGIREELSKELSSQPGSSVPVDHNIILVTIYSLKETMSVVTASLNSAMFNEQKGFILWSQSQPFEPTAVKTLDLILLSFTLV